MEANDASVGSQFWRLNHLYNIINEQGEAVSFAMRPAQQQFFQDFWYYNIVLKARQLGFTTMIDLLALDMVIFKKNFTAVIIAETKDKAADIFNSKVVYPYEHLPKEIRDWCPVKAKSTDGVMELANGSSIKVMVSARSGTCQFLHVSEYGPVCAKSPAKALEIKVGSFPAVHPGGFCFVESTAMGNSGYFYELVQQAKRRQHSKLGMQDFKLHFYPWHENPAYQQDPSNVVIPSRLYDYFDTLFAKHGIILSEEQMAWYASQEQVLHDDIKSEFPSFVDEAFEVAQKGAYYAEQFNKIYADQRICNVPVDPYLPVYTAWDLGMSDQTSIWFIQLYGKEVRVIDYYANSGESLAHYIGVLKAKGYSYARHFAPHDIGVRELSTGATRMETARKLGCNFDRIPTCADLADGIEATRELLAYCYFDDSRTSEGRKCLEAYKHEWDEKGGCYKSHPCHDWASHGADAFRTFAVAWKLGLTASAAEPHRQIRNVGGLKRR